MDKNGDKAFSHIIIKDKKKVAGDCSLCIILSLCGIVGDEPCVLPPRQRRSLTEADGVAESATIGSTGGVYRNVTRAYRNNRMPVSPSEPLFTILLVPSLRTQPSCIFRYTTMTVSATISRRSSWHRSCRYEISCFDAGQYTQHQ